MTKVRGWREKCFLCLGEGLGIKLMKETTHCFFVFVFLRSNRVGSLQNSLIKWYSLKMNWQEDTCAFKQDMYWTFMSLQEQTSSLVPQTVQNLLQCGRPGSEPQVGKILWRRAWQPTPVFLPIEPPWTEEPGGLQSMGSQRVGPDWAAKHKNKPYASKSLCAIWLWDFILNLLIMMIILITCQEECSYSQ